MLCKGSFDWLDKDNLKVEKLRLQLSRLIVRAVWLAFSYLSVTARLVECKLVANL